MSAALTAVATDGNRVREISGRFLEIADELEKMSRIRIDHAWNAAESLVTYPDTPSNAAAATLRIAARFARGARPTGPQVEIAAAFARRFVLRLPVV